MSEALASKIEHLITIMEKVEAGNYAFNLTNWYQRNERAAEIMKQYDSPEELHNCGTAACFAGWCVLDPVVKGSLPEGFLDKNWVDPHDALVHYLLVEEKLNHNPHDIILATICGIGFRRVSDCYGTGRFHEVDAPQVIKALKEWLAFVEDPENQADWIKKHAC